MTIPTSRAQGEKEGEAIKKSDKKLTVIYFFGVLAKQIKNSILTATHLYFSQKVLLLSTWVMRLNVFTGTAILQNIQDSSLGNNSS